MVFCGYSTWAISSKQLKMYLRASLDLIPVSPSWSSGVYRTQEADVTLKSHHTLPSGKALFTLGSLYPLVVDVQQDSTCPLRNPGVAHKHPSNSQGWLERLCVEANYTAYSENSQPKCPNCSSLCYLNVYYVKASTPCLFLWIITYVLFSLVLFSLVLMVFSFTVNVLLRVG